MKKFEFRQYREPRGGELIGDYQKKLNAHLQKELARFTEQIISEVEQILKDNGING